VSTFIGIIYGQKRGSDYRRVLILPAGESINIQER
jgi:hypothetical protein